ncbi:hypothetical protein ACFE04_030780 [Oxalis oulophora]
MCKGISHQGNQTSSFSFSNGESNNYVCCELCRSRATLYCQADDAFLCRKCDTKVHGANFLALRHVRCFLCNSCQNLTNRYLIGASREVLPRVPPPVVTSQAESTDRPRQCDVDNEKDCSSKITYKFL